MLRSVLAATEFSNRCDIALARAVQIATQMRADLTLVHVSSDGKAGHDELDQAAQASMAEGLLGSGDPSRFILETARRKKADLLVLGAPVRSSVRDFLSGTTAEKVIRHSQVPVLMAAGTSPEPYRKVILATDFSEASEHAAYALKKTGLAANALVQLVNIYETPQIPLMIRAGTSSAEIESYVVQQGRVAAAKLAEFDAKTRCGASAFIPKLSQASTGRMICTLAVETEADLIVVGTQGHSGIKRFMLGSVAEEVLRLSQMDVLAIPVSA
ncbi:MAG: hypothetical protein CVT79_01575 [Alphaproteobacteria bacterium HGW-Alphaproteobacteria-18]|nr:MAG: hypothetical protein CVT79_01575 [Alphaproteobacteria bacterium HGW-Alphaproteobacteria-18]